MLVVLALVDAFVHSVQLSFLRVLRLLRMTRVVHLARAAGMVHLVKTATVRVSRGGAEEGGRRCPNTIVHLGAEGNVGGLTEVRLAVRCSRTDGCLLVMESTQPAQLRCMAW